MPGMMTMLHVENKRRRMTLVMTTTKRIQMLPKCSMKEDVVETKTQTMAHQDDEPSWRKKYE
jgi:hypothetical protein